MSHVPVMLHSLLAALRVRPGGTYLDCTFGRGGHTAAILDALDDAGQVLALDRDPGALMARPDLLGDSRLTLVHARFGAVGEMLAARGLKGRLDGVVMDLGVSSPQLDDAARGFSFRQDGPLDMRMDPTRGESAADWLARASQDDIEHCLREYGEERFARRIARRICERRAQSPITTTAELAAVVAGAVPRREGRIHLATRTFQALRIQVNDELGELRAALPALAAALAPAGRLCVISFHSLEDRIVKRYFRDLVKAHAADGGDHATRFLLPQRKPIDPDAAEIATNPRARSAHLRVLERAT